MDVLKDEKIRKYTQAIHIAGLGHGVVGSHDQFYQRFFTVISESPSFLKLGMNEIMDSRFRSPRLRRVGAGGNDRKMHRFLKRCRFTECAKIPFVNPVRVVFDYSPLSLLKYPWESQQIGLFKDAISWIKYIQQSAQMNESIRAN